MPVADALLGHGDVVGQRRAAEAAEVERQDDVPLGAEVAGDAGGRLELDPVALVVIDGEREEAIAGLAGEAGDDHRIHAAGEEDYCGSGLRSSPRL